MNRQGSRQDRVNREGSRGAGRGAGRGSTVEQAGEGTAGCVAGKPERSREGAGEQAGGVLLSVEQAGDGRTGRGPGKSE